MAKNRLAAGLEMGGLSIQTVENTVQGFQQNLIQKIYKKTNQPAGDSLLPNILSKLLLRVNRPTLEDHVERLGAEQWNITATRLHTRNKMFAQAFKAVATLQTLYEVDRDGWHHAVIYGYTRASKLFPFTAVEAALFRYWDIIVVSQLYNTNYLTRMLDRTENAALANRIQQYPLLKHKLQLLGKQL